MSAKQERIEELISALSAAGTWVSSSTLSKRAGITERTVRNYIAEINARGAYEIESSHLGYRLNTGAAAAPEDEHKNGAPAKTDRVNVVLSRLINADGPVSVFDLAEEIGISDSTLLNTVAPKLRRLAKQYGVTLEQRDFELSLNGSEEGLRKLLGYMATNGSEGGYFNSIKTLEVMFPDFDIQKTLDALVDICQKSELFLNNYALNNLMMHLLVILIRLRDGKTLGDTEAAVHSREIVESLTHKESIIRCTDRISAYALSEYGVWLSPNDYRQVVALITLSTEAYSSSELSHENLVRLMGQEFFDEVMDMLSLTCERYGLAPFNEDFLLQFALHVHNAWQRSAYGVPCPNPIAQLIKQDYAAVYDIAVFFAHQFSTRLGQTLSEDEIGFIAYHLGAYLEEHKNNGDKTSCIVVYEHYHDFVSGFLHSIEEEFGASLEVVGVMDYQTYLESGRTADIVITTIGLRSMQPHTVLVSPILSRRSTAKIRQEIDEVAREHKTEIARSYARKYFSPKLFWRNVSAASPEGAIRAMGEHIVELGYATKEFVTDVILREEISGTAFTDMVAVPHAVGCYAEKSFIAVLHNDAPIPWGGRKVNFVLMLGLAQEDMHYFQDVLDIVIDLYLSPEKSAKILATDTYEEFVSVVCGE
jgi:lichenan operon transcriptional antiterminator